MNVLLSRLGIPPEVQDFFQVGDDDLVFHYGDSSEHFGEGFHKLPVTKNLWLAGLETAAKVVVTYSAMEAIAFAAINRHRYSLERLAFIAIGSRLQKEQVTWLRHHFPNRTFILAFGKDLIGQITAIKLAAGVRNIPLQIYYAGNQVSIYSGEKLLLVNQELVSLHLFQEKFGVRPRFRTALPASADSFLVQLQKKTD